MPVQTPVPGDFFLSRIRGRLGFSIMLGQALAGDASVFCHAGFVMPDGKVFAAQPRGARFDEWTSVAEPVALSTGRVPLTDEQRAKIIELCHKMEGTPYSFVDYLAIALHRFGVHSKRLDKYITSSKHMICSQLVDYILCEVGVHLFDDGRLSQNVTPGSIANALLERW